MPCVACVAQQHWVSSRALRSDPCAAGASLWPSRDLSVTYLYNAMRDSERKTYIMVSTSIVLFFCLRLLCPGMRRYVRISWGDISLREIIVTPLLMR